MKRVSFVLTPCLLTALTPVAHSRGVSPYLPLQLEPEIERQVERVLVLGDKPVLTRPIAAATVLDALPKACRVDPELCAAVRRYLRSYMENGDIVHASIEGAVVNDDDKSKTNPDTTIPNSYGLRASSTWRASVQAYFQPSGYALLSVGGIAYDGQSMATGTMLSVGFDKAQLDIGYREHGLSPMTDSSMLLSTNSPSMPSVTLSNYAPLTRFGLQYEAFVALMEKSRRIVFQDGLTEGYPRLAGLHLSTEPVSGWALGFNRIMQFGGGKRGGDSFSDLVDAFFRPSKFDNIGDGVNNDTQFGNQAGAITSSFLFPGKHAFSVYFEYAGEDTSNAKDYLLGNSALSAGINIPRLLPGLDFTYETSEWQNGWYVHNIYLDGLTNDQRVIGHWGADQRLFNDGVGGQSHMVRLGWEPKWGGLLEVRYRTLTNEKYLDSGVPYERAQSITARYSMQVSDFTVGAEVFAGNDVFGDDFSRVAAFARYAPNSRRPTGSFESESATAEENDAEIFVDVGANANKVDIDLANNIPDIKTQTAVAPHFAVGARRAVSMHSDFGVRLEFDDVDGHSLIGARALDYRYRFGNHFATGVFLGAARYDVATPAYGIYGGLGVQWRNFLPGWDIGADMKYAYKVARDHLLPSDPQSVRPDSFYDIYAGTLYVTKRF